MSSELETLLRGVVGPNHDTDVPALTDRIKSMFEPRTPTYGDLEMEAALCVWEWINDVTLLPHASNMSRPEWIELREALGSAEMRHQSIALGKWCLQIWDICTKHDEDFFDGLAYDWEVIPMMLDYACDSEGKPVIYEDAMPAPERVALLVAHQVLFDEFRGDCRREAQTQWGYAELSDDGGDDRVLQAFANGETPAEFIKWLGEKYDLIPAREWARGF